MNLIDEYLNKLNTEYGYGHPIQTRPKPKSGVTGEEPKKDEAGKKGPSGLQVDLEKEKE